MSLLHKLAEGWLQTLEDIEAGASEPDAGPEACLTQFEQNVLSDLRRVFDRPAPPDAAQSPVRNGHRAEYQGRHDPQCYFCTHRVRVS